MITAHALHRLPGVRHGFFTRRGGVSEGPYESLNCGYGSGDDRRRVAANRRRAMQRLGADGECLTAYQIHSDTVITVESPWSPEKAPRADGLVVGRPGVALGVLTADCVPVLFADATAGVVGVAHGGWRGALAGIMEATVEAMAGLGADPSRISAAVGPCIHQRSYQVGPEFHAAFMEETGLNGEFFAASERPGHHLFDLPGYVRHRLQGLGLGAVEVLAHDTCEDETRFFSYRRATLRGEAGYGRLLSVITLKE